MHWSYNLRYETGKFAFGCVLNTKAKRRFFMFSVYFARLWAQQVCFGEVLSSVKVLIFLNVVTNLKLTIQSILLT